MYDTFGLFIGGAWTAGGTTLEVLSPVTEKPLGRCAAATADETPPGVAP